ncbi:hypothetical protein MKW92_034730 [Papaver armeniacum]|nr:hypothetical protein MKW92_034730 [Papaver armeniacum]
MGETTYCISSNNEEEDGDAERKAAINYLATDVSNQSADSNGPVPKTSNECFVNDFISDFFWPRIGKSLWTSWQVQKLLEDMLDKSLEMVNAPVDEGDGISLFRHAPLGIVFDPVDDSKLPRKRPKILPRYEVFKRQMKSNVVDGVEIIASARDACKKSLARLEAKDVAAKAKSKREEERVAELKKIKGENWLPYIARHMRVSFQAC